MKKFLEYLRASVTAANLTWKLLTFLIVVGGGTTAGFLAKSSQLFAALGAIAWFGIALISALILALIIFLIRNSQRATAEANLAIALASRPNEINPLLRSFEDLIIPVHALRLPGKQLHQYKHFRRCKFVGPGAMALMGGTFVRNNFIESGDVLTLPDKAKLSGLTVLQDCTLEDCEFYQITLFFPKSALEALSKVPGVQIAL